MSAAAATADAATAAKPKSKKLLFILIGVVVLALAGAGGAFYILKKNTADEDGEESSHSAESERAARTPPTFLPLEAMVVNLSDPGGNRFAQLGITLQVQDSQTAEAIKVYMPTIRSAILMLISQRSSEQMLQLEGKEKLSADIVREISRVMDYAPPEKHEAGGEPEAKPAKKRRDAPPNPLQGVLFSSFIVQ